MIKSLYISIVILLFSALNLKASIFKIENYSAYLGTAQYQNSDWLILRKYSLNNVSYTLCVNVANLTTQSIPLKELQSPMSSDWNSVKKKFKNSPYIRNLTASQKLSSQLQDAGFQQGNPEEKGIALTIDLCPSHKPLDKILFNKLIDELGPYEAQIPVALSITGKFLQNHKEDINWLIELENLGKIKITWINHTFNHFYNPSLPLNQNFLLAKNTNINQEVLWLEQALLELGITPSIFFRFPGLVSDQRIFNQIESLGLLPIGSDAWLAKGDKAVHGAVVLVHGNGNEPVGIVDFLQLLKQEQKEEKSKQWKLLDLRTMIINNRSVLNL